MEFVKDSFLLLHNSPYILLLILHSVILVFPTFSPLHLNDRAPRM